MNMDYKTKIIHSGMDRDPFTGASSIPIYQVSTFAQKDPVDFGPYEYGRGANPTRDALEQAVADLEGGERGLAFASGMAAISSVLLLFQPGDHLVVSEDVYGGTFRILTTLFHRWGLQATFVDSADPENVRAAISPKTRGVFVETPSNPLLKITDLTAIGEIAREAKVISIIDNTFMSPYLQRPFEYGFDISIHSATKFLGGHSDLIAGVVAVRETELGHRLKFIQNVFGAILGPQDSWLLLRGMRTLGARLDVQQKSAENLAVWLTTCPEIKNVYYPGLPHHPGHEIHQRQARGSGAVVSFELFDGETAREFMRNVNLPLLAVSLGGVESILSYPATMSHGSMPPAERNARGITDALVRLSVGLEDPTDLKIDLAQALEKAVRSHL